MNEYNDLHAAFLTAIVTSSNDAIISKDLDGIVTTWNAAASRLFGYEPEEIIGRSIMTIVPASLRAEEDTILNRIRRGERVEHFDTVRQTKDGIFIPVSLAISPLIDNSSRILGASKIARDISERKRSEERRQLHVKELKHRVKNVLSIVRAIAGQTYNEPELAARNAVFSQRIAALAKSCDMLTDDGTDTADLRDLVEAVLEPFRPNDQAIRIEAGLKVELTGRQANALALAFNELATNATKYGALSKPGGSVSLSWTEAPQPEGGLVLDWIERGGPRVDPPQRAGFGSQLLNLALKHDLSAQTELSYPPEGFEFHLQF